MICARTGWERGNEASTSASAGVSVQAFEWKLTRQDIRTQPEADIYGSARHPVSRPGDLLSLVDLPMVVPLRCLCARSLRPRRRARGRERFFRVRSGCWRIVVAGPPARSGHHLRLGALGDASRNPSREANRRRRRLPRPARYHLSSARGAGTCDGICAEPRHRDQQ